MVFYYCFASKFGYDQVCRDYVWHGQAGDLIESNGTHFLVLGDQLSRQDQYEVSSYRFEIMHSEIIGKLFASQTLELVHWMVHRYYTSYKSVVGLFVSNLSQYITYTQKTKTLKKKDTQKHSGYNSLVLRVDTDRSNQIQLCHDSGLRRDAQTLIVFPDLLGLRYRFQDREYILSGKDTTSKVMKYYVDLQKGYKNILITTGANICMDYKQLSQIICYFPKTWYYKYRQDPRIWIPEVLEKMAEIWKAKIVYIEVK